MNTPQTDSLTPRNTHNILDMLVQKTRCKPGWRFRLIDDPEEGLRLCIAIECVNSRNESERMMIHHFFPVPVATYNEKTWRRWIFDCCLGVETHELGEFFKVGKERPFAPLHGPGENPYVVHEFRDRVDAHTLQDGSIAS